MSKSRPVDKKLPNLYHNMVKNMYRRHIMLSGYEKKEVVVENLVEKTWAYNFVTKNTKLQVYYVFFCFVIFYYNDNISAQEVFLLVAVKSV
jgi:hypothetical protein